jgi:hypothetical protein
MARIAVLEEAEAIRDEEDVGPDPDAGQPSDAVADLPMDVDGVEDQPPEGSPAPDDRRAKYIPTTFEIQEAFDAVNTLRYSQPTHLSGASSFPRPDVRRTDIEYLYHAMYALSSTPMQSNAVSFLVPHVWRVTAHTLSTPQARRRA